jgi:hypothetical protein
LQAVKSSPFHPLLFGGFVLLVLPPGLYAADRVHGVQKTQAVQVAAATPKKKGFFATLFGGKSRKADESRKSAITSSLPRSQLAAPNQKPPVSASHTAPIYADLSQNALNRAVAPRSLAPSRVVMTPVYEPSMKRTLPDSAKPALDTNVPSLGKASATPLPGTPGFSAANVPPAAETETVRAPLPSFGLPVPGKPGMVYLPGMERTSANIVDVTGLTPGSTVRDPVTKITFLVP